MPSDMAFGEQCLHKEEIAKGYCVKRVAVFIVLINNAIYSLYEGICDIDHWNNYKEKLSIFYYAFITSVSVQNTLSGFNPFNY
ncbi:hypothetical protein AFK69_15955 [Xenorhabdus sp. GDc328]|nr:hypothetical protein AAY47_09550 [Xenorhabdus griffiniae]KOP32315.1 hypothetical protein AFK69_15955 [Xenorhabdus sp. GDc328]